MRRKFGSANLLRRIEDFESRSVDGSGLVPHSPAWLESWQRQVRLYETGQPHVQLTLEAVRAVLRAIPDRDDGGSSETTQAA